MDDDDPPRKALEQPATPNASTSITMVNGPDTGHINIKGKERCRITVSFRDEIQKICWYGEDTPAKNIEDVIRTAFGLPHHASLLLKNSEGDVVAVSSSLPSNEIFHLQVGGSSTRQLMISREQVGEEDDKLDRDRDRDDLVKHEGDTDSDSSSPSSSPTSSSTHIVHVGHHDGRSSPPISIKVPYSPATPFLHSLIPLIHFFLFLDLSFIFS